MQLITSSRDQYTSLESLDVKIVSRDENNGPVGQDLNLVVAANVLSHKALNVLKNLSNSLKPGGFLLLEETNQSDASLVKDPSLIYVASQSLLGKTYLLLKKKEEIKETIVIQMTEKNYGWLDNAKAALKKAAVSKQDVIFVGQGEELLGMTGFMNCMRREEGGWNTRYVFIMDKNAPKFSLTDKFYASQLNKQLVANVLKGGHWGSYRLCDWINKAEYRLFKLNMHTSTHCTEVT